MTEGHCDKFIWNMHEVRNEVGSKQQQQGAEELQGEVLSITVKIKKVCF